jgi:glycosyltransferase involved in cell wall biosynthesis
MRGAAIWFTRENRGWLDAAEPIDAMLCSDMVSVTDLRAMLPRNLRNVPIACYFHENQLTYPVQPGEGRDLQYGMTNITSCLAADAVWFNSEFHRQGFLAAAGDLLSQMPDFVPREAMSEMAAKCSVLPPPIPDLPASDRHSGVAPLRRRRSSGDGFSDDPPIILWCHRWEYDKNPEPFFRAVLALDQERVPFRLILLGEQFTHAPPIFADVWPRVQRHVIHAGYLESRADYLATLRRCDIVVSSAIQEFCGLAVIEAMLSGCQPLLPNRLSYPELIPAGLHAKCLYNDDAALLPALRESLLEDGRRQTSEDRRSLVRFLHERFGMPHAVARIDDALGALGQRGA